MSPRSPHSAKRYKSIQFWLWRQSPSDVKADKLLDYGVAQLRDIRPPKDGVNRLLEALELPAAVSAPRRRQGFYVPKSVRWATAVLAVSGFAWNSYINLQPEISFPMTGAQVWQAYNTSGTKPTDWEPTSVTRRLDASGEAYNLIVHASAIMGDSGATGKIGAKWPAAVAEPGTAEIRKIEATLQKYAPALKMVHAALHYQYVPVPIRTGTSVDHLLLSAPLAVQLRLEAREHEARGEFAQAASCALDAIQLGCELGDGDIQSRLVGLGEEFEGREELWTLLPKLDARTARESSLRLMSIVHDHVPMDITILREEVNGHAALWQLFNTPQWRLRTTSVQEATQRSDVGIFEHAAVSAYLLKLSDRRILQDYDTWMERQRTSGGNGVDVQSDEYDDLRSDRVASLRTPAFSGLRFLDSERGELQNSLLAVKIALRAYELDHRPSTACPATLDALVPVYLKYMPIDVFNNGVPLQFLLTQNIRDCKVYSVGPDGYDNLGDAIPVKYRDGSSAGGIEQGDRGDIVAGVNRD